ncbi:hypothetical protein M8J76_000910 [Diaphorina citri]|nr:hypothetical protein M8J76_000910 [Diaphorina citri]
MESEHFVLIFGITCASLAIGAYVLFGPNFTSKKKTPPAPPAGPRQPRQPRQQYFQRPQQPLWKLCWGQLWEWLCGWL